MKSPFLLSGLAKCAECEAAMIGKEDWSGRRNRPYRYYLCGRKNREGYASCPSGNIHADGPEQAVLAFVRDRVLTLDYVLAIQAELEMALAQQEPVLAERVDVARQQLEEVERSIEVLLDLAEQFGAASAGTRLVEREADRERLRGELRRLEGQQEQQRLVMPPETIEAKLVVVRAQLTGKDVQARRALLKDVVVWVELEKDRGKV